MKFEFKQPRDFWDKDVDMRMWQSKWVALDKNSQVILTFGT